MSIIVSKKGSNAQIIDKSDFNNESSLQEYIHNNPESIPIYEIQEDKKLFVAKREFRTTSGPVDALAVDKDGDIYVVETKLYKNPDKRKVVAQALDYGAALWKHSVDFNEFIAILNADAQEKFTLDFQEKITEFFNIDDDQSDLMIKALRRNLNEGVIKFVILMDSIDDRLKDLILYVNQNSQFDIYAVQLEYYEFKENEIIIPKIFGVETKKTVNRPENIKKWDSVAWFEELEKRRGQEEAKIVRKMEQWATGGPFQFRWSSRRKDDRATFWMFLTSEPPCRLLGFRLDGKIEIRFGDLMKFRPFNEEELRRSLTDRLNRIAGINLSEALKLTGYPSVPISAIKDEGDATSFFETIEWCIKEIKEAKID